MGIAKSIDDNMSGFVSATIFGFSSRTTPSLQIQKSQTFFPADAEAGKQHKSTPQIYYTRTVILSRFLSCFFIVGNIVGKSYFLTQFHCFGVVFQNAENPQSLTPCGFS
jgi:hypothetical protein